ncbi:MAG: class I SAM-dependent methyltransferase [Fimbriimonas sp.]|nr:class I SAM-dependent methyltransferase [Fimbriimonas sp.]
MCDQILLFTSLESMGDDPFRDELWIMAERMWERGDYGNCLQFLARRLDLIRTSLTSDQWKAYILDVRTSKRLIKDILRSPLSFRTNSKPRGYAGDAETLDLIYGAMCPSTSGEIDPVLYAAEFGGPPACSVRDRAMVLAEFIDSVCEARVSARLLSIACGHLREAGASSALSRGSCSELVAFDQDRESLATITRDYPHLPIRTIEGDVRRIIVGRFDLGLFDGIYCAGLYDYLNDRTATRLTTSLFSMLRPGGRLLLANFAPDTAGIGFMECIQDWFLTYRSEADLVDLMSEIPPSERSSVRTFRDRMQNIAFLEVERCGSADTTEPQTSLAGSE